MSFKRFDLPGPVEIVPALHGDERGYFTEVYREDLFRANVEDVALVQENQSLSVRQGTIRGLHYQTHPYAQGKLVRCITGAIFDIAVDIRRGSPTFGQWIAVELSASANNMLWVPVGFAHGFCTLTPNAVVCYKVTNYYDAPSDKGIAWNDPDIAITWPGCADPATLSAKDGKQPSLADLPAHFTF